MLTTSNSTHVNIPLYYYFDLYNLAEIGLGHER